MKNTRKPSTGGFVLRVALLVLCALGLGGCIASTVVGAAAEVVEAGVEITGAAVGAAVDVVDGDDDDD